MKPYKAKPARRTYIEKQNGKMRPLGIPTILDRIIQECLRIVLEPIVEARLFPNSYGFRPYRATKHAGMYIGITKAFLTHSQWGKYCFNQKITPYTKEGNYICRNEIVRENFHWIDCHYMMLKC